MRRGMLLVLLAAGLGAAMPAAAIPPVPLSEVIDTVRSLAADEIRVKKKDIDVTRSLAAQGFDESSLASLVVAVNQEFGVTISEDDLRRAKWNEPAVPLSVRRIADMVVRQMQPAW